MARVVLPAPGRPEITVKVAVLSAGGLDVVVIWTSKRVTASDHTPAADVRAFEAPSGTVVDGGSWSMTNIDMVRTVPRRLSVGQDQHVIALGWIVLFLVFVDELLAMVAFGVWGWQHNPPWLLVWALPLVAMAVWSLFASPKARYGGPVVRPVTKVTVFGLACLALYDAGHTGWAIGLLVFSVVVNALAMVPSIRRLAESPVG